MMDSYWRESVMLALEDAGVEASDEQIVLVAEALVVSRENEGLALGREHISHPLEAKLRDSYRQRRQDASDLRAVSDALREEIVQLRRDVRYWRGRATEGHC